MKLSEDSLEKIKEKLLKKDKLLIMLLVGLIIFVFFLPVGSSKKDNNDGELSESINDTKSLDDKIISQEEYREQLEKQLSDILENAYGVGKVKVMITLSSTSESVVKENKALSNSDMTEEDSGGGTRNTKTSESESTTVFAQAENGQTPYVVKENMPAVAGVLVIAKGGEDAVVAQNISDAVKALFGIEAHKIKVMKMVE